MLSRFSNLSIAESLYLVESNSECINILIKIAEFKTILEEYEEALNYINRALDLERSYPAQFVKEHAVLLSLEKDIKKLRERQIIQDHEVQDHEAQDNEAGDNEVQNHEAHRSRAQNIKKLGYIIGVIATVAYFIPKLKKCF